MNNNVGLIGIGVFALLIGSCSAAYQYGTQDSLSATVRDKERVCEGGDGGCKWMVMTDEMSFINSDAFFHLKFSSTDMQSSLEVGKEYQFDYYGWRIPFFSVYPNILEATEINQ